VCTADLGIVQDIAVADTAVDFFDRSGITSPVEQMRLLNWRWTLGMMRTAVAEQCTAVLGLTVVASIRSAVSQAVAVLGYETSFEERAGRNSSQGIALESFGTAAQDNQALGLQILRESAFAIQVQKRTFHHLARPC
jgi:hypothetical protein